MDRLKHKTAVITGGTSGIGLESAKQFIEEGARIIITGQNEQRLAAVAKQIGSNAIGARGAAGRNCSGSCIPCQR